jgi:hypothetical protein
MAADAADMIEGKIAEAGRTFAARVAARAALLAKAHAETALRTRGHDPSRWRRAALLWPLFAKDR